MTRRLGRLLRLVIVVASWAFALYQVAQLVRERGRPLVAADAETGDVYGFRISPLTAAELLRAEARARLASEDWADALNRQGAVLSGEVDTPL